MKELFSAQYEQVKADAARFIAEQGLSVPDEDHIVTPGLCDVHVHFREPGFSYKETIASGTAAAARGGYTAVCTMPNLQPVPDCPEKLHPQIKLIREQACIRVLPYGAVTVDELGREHADLQGLAPLVCAFSDDGHGIQSAQMMREAMEQAARLNMIIAAHCEDNSLLNGGYIHDGEYARRHGHRGICSASEYKQIERDLRLAADTGCAYHVCHISTRESVALIREAKAAGVNVSCETAPHYLLLCEDDLQEDGRFKMNPPLRSAADRDALLEGICDGTIDMIATDHAPHSAEEKSRGLEKSAMGVVGLETAFAVLYSGLVKRGIIGIDRLLELMSFAPRQRFGIYNGSDFALFELSQPYVIDPQQFRSQGRATPFAGRQVQGKCLLTVHHGRIVYRDEQLPPQK